MGGGIVGHVIPGTAFLGLALFTWWLERFRRGERPPLAFGLFVSVATGVGLLAELVDNHGSDSDSVLEHIRLSKEHCAMYSAFLLAGVLALLESKATLPRVGTWRLGIAGGLLVEGFVFYGHSIMQMDHEHNMTESLVHWMLSLACLGGALGYALGAAVPTHCHEWTLLGSGFVLLQALWFYFLSWALYGDYYAPMAADMDMGAAFAYFSLAFLLAGFVTVLVSNRMSPRAGEDPAVVYEPVDAFEKA